MELETVDYWCILHLMQNLHNMPVVIPVEFSALFVVFTAIKILLFGIRLHQDPSNWQCLCHLSVCFIGACIIAYWRHQQWLGAVPCPACRTQVCTDDSVMFGV